VGTYKTGERGWVIGLSEILSQVKHIQKRKKNKHENAGAICEKINKKNEDFMQPVCFVKKRNPELRGGLRLG